ncbi:5313_t:CDS:2, partial [Dentiscutata erythropus]
LEAENAELKAENAEIPGLRKKFAEVEAKNAKLETENFEAKAEIMKLRPELKSVSVQLSSELTGIMRRPEFLAKRVWEVVGNDGTPDRWKYLGIIPRDESYYYINRELMGKLIFLIHYMDIPFRKLLQQEGYVLLSGSDYDTIPNIVLILKKISFIDKGTA